MFCKSHIHTLASLRWQLIQAVYCTIIYNTTEQNSSLSSWGCLTAKWNAISWWTKPCRYFWPPGKRCGL